MIGAIGAYNRPLYHRAATRVQNASTGQATYNIPSSGGTLRWASLDTGGNGARRTREDEQERSEYQRTYRIAGIHNISFVDGIFDKQESELYLVESVNIDYPNNETVVTCVRYGDGVG